MFADLVVAEARGVLDQLGREVVAGVGTLPVDQLLEGPGDVLVAGHRGLRTVEHVLDGGGQARPVLLRHTEQLGHDTQRKPVGELPHQVGLSRSGELVDQLVGEAGDVAADAT